MRHIESICVLLGGILIAAGIAAVYWPAALIVAGLLLVVAAYAPTPGGDSP